MPAPSNQTCLTAEVISSLPFDSGIVDTTLAGDSPSTPDCLTGNSYNSIWYKWTCPIGVTRVLLYISDPASNTGLTGLSGTCGALVDEGVCGFSPTLNSVPGTTYFFLITSFTPGGSSSVRFRVVEVATPTNDTCATAEAVVPTTPSILIAVDPTTAGNSPSIPDSDCFGSGNSYNSVFYTWTPGPTITQLILTFGDNFTFGGIWTLFEGNCGTPVYTGYCGYAAPATLITVVGGTPYILMLTSFTAGATDLYALELEAESVGPSGDFCTVLSCVSLELSCPTSIGQIGFPYSSAFTASNGTLPYAFSIIGGALPGGLSLNPSTGAVTGTPTTAGTFNFIGQVEDDNSNTATAECSIVILGTVNPCDPIVTPENPLDLTSGIGIDEF